MTTLNIKNFGQIKEANLSFGDLTVLVGPQATGKSIALQLLKLMVDAGQVQEELNRYGLDWDQKLPEFMNVYFGEGMQSIWHAGESSVVWEGKSVDLIQLARRKQRNKTDSLFSFPAQRVLALRDGWPRPFTDYTPGDPFAVREFSEKLRVLVEQEFGSSGDLFPQERRLKEFREMLQKHVFSNFNLKVDRFRSQKRLVLGTGPDSSALPYMVWSAGQREFVPLLLGLYWLMPPAKVATRGDIKWVVLEELEMGLHPRAITVVLLLVFELVARGYRVCLSTHSPQVLDAVWALKHMRENNSSAEALLKIFEASGSPSMQKLANTMMEKTVKVHYFNRETGTTEDISALDPSAEGQAEAGWGGLSEFSGRANEAVARAVSNTERKGGSMTFKDAVEKTPHLKGQWKSGIQALRAEDKPHIQAENTRQLSGSADIDTALKKIEPQANRWDFAIAYRHANRSDEFIYWVETHTGSDNQIKVVLKKMEWLKSWLKKDGKKLDSFDRDFLWVSSGYTLFNKGSMQVKALAQKGIIYTGKQLRIPKNRS